MSCGRQSSHDDGSSTNKKDHDNGCGDARSTKPCEP